MRDRIVNVKFGLKEAIVLWDMAGQITGPIVGTRGIWSALGSDFSFFEVLGEYIDNCFESKDNLRASKFIFKMKPRLLQKEFDGMNIRYISVDRDQDFKELIQELEKFGFTLKE